MRNGAAYNRWILIAFMAFAMTHLTAVTSRADTDETSLARQIAERVFSEELLIAGIVAQKEEVVRQLRSKLGAKIDVSGVSDRDLGTVAVVQSEINAAAVSAGMVKFFENKIGELSRTDQLIILSCLKSTDCDRQGISEEAREFFVHLPSLAKSKGEELGTAVGISTAPQLYEKLRQMDESKFDDREELLRVVQTKVY